MPFTVAEAARLEKSLLEAGSEDIPDTQAFVCAVRDWFAERRPQDRGVLDAETFAFLCETVRSSSDATARALAGGALRIVQRDVDSFPHRVGFAARFAVQRIRAIANLSPLWGSVPLSQKEQADAQALYEVALDDRSYKVEDLLAGAREFIEQYRSDTTMFGRLAADLERLLRVISDENALEVHRDIARAALTYFVVSADAIPDELGFLGLLDDIFIVRHAIDRIYPKRASLVGAVDEVLLAWPFTRDLRLDLDSGGTQPLSEFALLNCRFLLSALNDSTGRGVAVVMPDSATLAATLGFLCSVAEISRHVDQKGWPAFIKGERLVNVEGGATVVFDAYGSVIGTEFQPMISSDAATHICFFARRSGVKKYGQEFNVKCVRRVEDVTSFKRADATRAGHGGSAVFAPESVTLGVLERLFGSSRPIVLPTGRARIIVVSPFSVGRELLTSLSVFRKSLLEVVPTGHARVAEAGIEYCPWTPGQDSQGPVLTFVRSVADAAVLADDPNNRIAAVICPVRPASADTISIVRIAGQGIPILALLEVGDADAVKHLRQSNFRCWVWEKSWLDELDWTPKQVGSNVSSTAEHALMERMASQTSTLSVELKGLTEAYTALEGLSDAGSEGDNDLLRLAIGDGFGLLVKLCRTVTPLNGELSDIERQMTQLGQTLHRGKAWWHRDIVALCDAVMDGFSTALSSLRTENPKYRALHEWVVANPEGQLMCGPTVRDGLQRYLPDTKLDLSGAANGARPMLIPAWYQRERMSRLLFPPVSPNVSLLLYAPERDWCDAAYRRHRSAVDQAREFAAAHPPLKSLSRALDPPRVDERPRRREPDEIIIQAGRAKALKYLNSVAGERVPARLIQFAGGHWAAYTDLHRIHTVTHLVENRDGEEEEIREVTASELHNGDLVLLLRGTDRDVLREEVDRVAPAGTRDAAAGWQRALRRCRQNVSFDDLVVKLDKAGCRRIKATIQRWLDDDSIIGPRTSADVEAVLVVTSDEELRNSLSVCLDSIALLRGLHIKVAQVLARRVLERARQWLDAGAATDELIEIEDQLVVATVEFVDEKLIEVPRAIVNRLQEQRLAAAGTA